MEQTVSIGDVATSEKIPVASYAHTLGLLGLFVAYFLIAFALSHKASVTATPVDAGARPNLLFGYLESMGFDWAILCYVWAGVSQRRVSLLQLAGGRWESVRQVGRDFLVALPFWIVWEGVAIGMSRLLATGSHAGSGRWIVPSTPIEILFWTATSASAGFCEELIFRGYLQRQLAALSQSAIFGIAAQGIVFGLIHPRGWRMVVTITALGWLYGALAAWRKDLKPNMVAHAISDLWEGWLKHLVPLSF